MIVGNNHEINLSVTRNLMGDGLTHFLQQVAGKDEVGEPLVG